MVKIIELSNKLDMLMIKISKGHDITEIEGLENVIKGENFQELKNKLIKSESTEEQLQHLLPMLRVEKPFSINNDEETLMLELEKKQQFEEIVEDDPTIIDESYIYDLDKELEMLKNDLFPEYTDSTKNTIKLGYKTASFSLAFLLLSIQSAMNSDEQENSLLNSMIMQILMSALFTMFSEKLAEENGVFENPRINPEFNPTDITTASYLCGLATQKTMGKIADKINSKNLMMLAVSAPYLPLATPVALYALTTMATPALLSSMGIIAINAHYERNLLIEKRDHSLSKNDLILINGNLLSKKTNELIIEDISSLPKDINEEVVNKHSAEKEKEANKLVRFASMKPWICAMVYAAAFFVLGLITVSATSGLGIYIPGIIYGVIPTLSACSGLARGFQVAEENPEFAEKLVKNIIATPTRVKSLPGGEKHQKQEPSPNKSIQEPEGELIVSSNRSFVNLVKRMALAPGFIRG